MTYQQDFTKAKSRQDLLKSMFQQNLQPQRRPGLASTLGRALAAYMMSKDIDKQNFHMDTAAQGQQDSRNMDMANVLSAYRQDTPYEADLFPGEAPIEGLRNMGTGHDREAMVEAMMGANDPNIQNTGMNAMLSSKSASPYGKYQPGDYTADSFAKFTQSGDPSVLEKDRTGRLIKVDRGDEIQFLHPVSGAVVKTETKKLSPSQTVDYKSDVKKAEAEAAADVKKSVEQQANNVTYTAFKAGIDDYQKALDGTLTGYIQGRLPAATASQQIADGAKSIMLPLLKSLFRGAGEGTFTDKDQELLEGMLPTRKDHPEAAKAKIDMVNKVVALKLGLDYAPKRQQGDGLEPGTIEDGYEFKGGDPSKPENWIKIDG